MSDTNDIGQAKDMGQANDMGGMGGRSMGGGAMDGGGLGGLLDGIRVYATEFTALNNSGVHAQALLFLDKEAQTLTVNIRAEGMEPGQAHAQHIHGPADDTEAKTPTIRQDDDGDGFVELAEGLDTYGEIQLNLTTEPGDAEQLTGMMGVAFPTADENGVLRYTETFRFDRDDPNAKAIFDGITPLEAKEIVLHGLTTTAQQGEGTEGEVDGTAGYKAVLPVASGELREVDVGALLSSALGHGQAGDWLFGA